MSYAPHCVFMSQPTALILSVLSSEYRCVAHGCLPWHFPTTREPLSPLNYLAFVVASVILSSPSTSSNSPIPPVKSPAASPPPEQTLPIPLSLLQLQEARLIYPTSPLTLRRADTIPARLRVTSRSCQQLQVYAPSARPSRDSADSDWHVIRKDTATLSIIL